MATEIDINFHSIASTTEEKKDVLMNFFRIQQTTFDGFTNSHKFLFLYGEENTGKLTLIKEVAQEVFGENWESCFYIREDKGQRYPYKLHAHKVESSRKVIIITNTREQWLKWHEMYPHTQAFWFRGIYIPPGQVLAENIAGNFRNYDIDLFKRNLQDTIDVFCGDKGITADLAAELKGKIIANVNQMIYS
jgi:DNA polymerase III delta prime subunit